MSFADRVRQELAALVTKHNCCRRSLTDGLLIGAELTGAKSVHVRYHSEEVATLALELLAARYGKAVEVQKSGRCGHVYWDVIVTAPACVRLIRAMDSGEANAVRFDCDGCRGAFLRGVFLAVGTVNDPHKSFHLEFKLPLARVALVSMFLEEIGYAARTVNRQGASGLYFKDSSTIEELITLMGASAVLFEVINSRIEREIRNNENRATNCVARNIEKTISAATKQMEAINKLMETGRLRSLPESLQVTAEQRYANPDATLDELVLLHVPSISRSGLNHRLKKIVDAADEL